jgi:hypothetical protein
MSRWGRALSAAGGVGMVVGGLLVLSGSRWGYLFVAAAYSLNRNVRVATSLKTAFPMEAGE